MQSPTGTNSLSALRFADPASIIRVQEGLRIRFGDLAGRLNLRGDTLVLPPVSISTIRQVPIGINPEQAALAKEAKLMIVARCGNPLGATPDYVQKTLTWAHNLGATVFLPQGDQVLGRRESIETTRTTLQSLGMMYASAEFAKIGGDEEMVRAAPENVVRLHSAQAAEVDKLSPIDAVDRYVKAARERNMRILLLRPLSYGTAQPLSALGEFSKEISRHLEKQGLVIGRPHAYGTSNLPRPYFLLLAFAIAPVAWYVASRFITNHNARIAIGAILGLLSLASIGNSGQQLMALIGSLTFPVLGFFAMDQWLDHTVARKKSNDIGHIVIGFWVVSLVALIGGLCVAGLLNGLPYFVKAAEFKAIKVSVFLPILVVGGHYAMKLVDWKKAMATPVTWGSWALFIAVSLGLAFMLARTGNDSGVGASGGEILFRNLLDRYLYVRPRTKEFMIGHPLLLVAIGFLLRSLAQKDKEVEPTVKQNAVTGWTVLALMIASVGQTSVVNTLCHLHIPVMLSMVRIFEGLFIGCILGIVAWVLIQKVSPLREA